MAQKKLPFFKVGDLVRRKGHTIPGSGRGDEIGVVIQTTEGTRSHIKVHWQHDNTITHLSTYTAIDRLILLSNDGCE